MTPTADSSASAEAVAAEALVGWPIVRHVPQAGPLPLADGQGSDCVLEGSQGRGVRVRLLELRQDEGLALIRIAPAWQLLEMPLARLCRLTLDTDQRPHYTQRRTLSLTLTGGRIARHETLAAQELGLGLFLLSPADDGLGWQRIFYPRSGYTSLVWGPPARPADHPCRTPDELRLALRVAQAHGKAATDAPQVDVPHYALHLPTLQRLPYSRARQLEVLPLGLLDGALVVVMDDPRRTDALAELGFLFGTRIEPVRPARHSTLHLVNELYERHGLAPATWRE